MNKSGKILFFALILICCFIGFILEEQQVKIKNKECRIENFDDFIKNFREDTVFQKSRLDIFDSYAILQSNELDSERCLGDNLTWDNFEEICKEIVRIDINNWQIITQNLLVVKNERNWFAKFNSINENTMEYVAGWNDASEAWYKILFKRKKGKWYLVELCDYDNVFGY
jgi:hypothetical protein